MARNVLHGGWTGDAYAYAPFEGEGYGADSLGGQNVPMYVPPEPAGVAAWSVPTIADAGGGRGAVPGRRRGRSDGGDTGPLKPQQAWATDDGATQDIGNAGFESPGGFESDTEPGTAPEDEGWLGEAMPHTARRRCTDVGWILPWLAGISGLAYLRCVGVPHSNIEVMRHLADYEGHLCGVGDHVNKPYLFFCLRNGQLDVRHMQCRASCPSSMATSFGCVSEVDGVPQWEDLHDYPTSPVAGLLCQPESRRLAHQMDDGRKGMLSDPAAVVLRMALTAWEPVAIAAVVGFALAVGFLLLLKHCASSLIWFGMLLLSVGPLVYGGVAIDCWHSHHLCQFLGKGMEQWQILTVGVCCCMLGLLFACLLMRQSHDIELAISCIEWALRCITQMPSLALHPFLVLLCRLGVVWLLQDVCLGVLSTLHEDIVTWKLGLDPMDVCVMLYVLFMFFWIMHFIASYSFFVVMYITEMWYFHGGMHDMKAGTPTPWCLALKGFWIGLRYHQGTLILGALATGAAQPFKLTVGALTGLARMDDNPVGRIIGAICCCCVACYEDFLELLSRNAYMDVAMSSRPFCKATDVAQAVLSADDAVHLLNGATWIFQIVGLGAIGVAGFATTEIIVANGFFGNSFAVPAEDDFVFNVFAFSLCGGAASIFVAFPFMMLFDIVSDVILYCHTVETLRQVEEAKEEQESWVTGFRAYLEELTGCSCSLRPKSVGGYPPKKEGPGPPQPAAKERRRADRRTEAPPEPRKARR